MKCPDCHIDMQPSKLGFLCLKCGKIVGNESADPQPNTSSITLPESHTPSTQVDQPSPAPNTQAAAASSLVDTVFDTSPLPEPARRKSHLKRNLLIVAAILAAAGAAGGFAYASFYEPTHAPTGYLLKLINSKRGQFAGTVDFKSDDATYSNYSFKLKANGAYDVSSQKNPKLDLNLEGSLGTGSLSGELKTLDKTLFLHVGSFSLFGNIGAALSKDWYKTDIGDSITRDKCQVDTKTSGSFLGIQLPGDFPVAKAKRVGLWETIAGHRTAHFQGVLDVNKLQAFIDKANKKLSADCKIDFSSSDYKSVTIGYDLWTSSGFDRISIKVDDTKSKSHVVSTFDTQKYNQPVNITAPAGAKSLESLFGDIWGGGTGSGLSLSGDSASASDALRKSDLRNVKTALETYFNDNNYYPAGTYAGLSKILSPTYIKSLPNDPKSGQTYTYTPGGCKLSHCQAYTLTAKLENSKDSSATNGLYTVVSIE